MPRFIHAADLHLDSPLKGLARYDGAPVGEARESSRRALENLVALALERRPDFVLLAGDLYDGDWKDYNTGLYFVGQMARLREAGVPVLLIHGNHDAASVMTRGLRLPDNVFSFPADAPYSRILNQCGTVVHGQSYMRRQVTENLGANYPAPIPGFFNIGLLHTSLETPGADKRYAPCSPADLAAKGYDYWALGHRHNLQAFSEAPPILFCGTTQGRDAGEPGPHGCVWVEAEAGNVSWELVHLDVLRWAVLDVDATGAADRAEVLSRASAALAAALDQADGRTLAVRFRLAGPCPAHARLAADPAALDAELRAEALDLSGGRAWVEKIALDTAPAQDLAALAASDTPQGDLLRFLDRLEADPALLAGLDPGLDDLWRKLKEQRGPAAALAMEDSAALAALLPRVRDLLLPLLLEQADEGQP
ncbi:MAG: DNA repair exonuclease [Thermodesulfobacteriota bacterium]